MLITPVMLARTRRFEDVISHMYLDTVGKVTIGTGHLVPSAAAAGTLLMKVAATGKAATPAQKKAEYAEMKKQEPGKKASYYEQFTMLAMDAAESDALLLADLMRSEGDLKSIFSGYASFPAAAQEALVDMAFNLGKTKFLKYADLIAACNAADWKTAAAECHRNGIPQDRNDEIRLLFESLAPKPDAQELAQAALTALAQAMEKRPHSISTTAGVRRMSLELRSGGLVARVVVETAEVPSRMLVSLPETCREGLNFDIFAADDLTLGQRVPDQAEADASGEIVKKVGRDDPEFDTFVRCDNANIVFKDEEGTEADRMMTPKLRDALVQLAAAASKEWPGTRVRVTEAWDEGGEHASTSLHYEGRAADLTTDPIDPMKLGRLGRLTTSCGFNWVYYENAAHLHVSVKR